MKEAKGGYFELELSGGGEYHHEAIKLNNGRNSIEYLIGAKKYQRFFIPYFTCKAILDTIKRCNAKYEFYHITEEFDPIFDFSRIQAKEAFIYTNYFGINGKKVNEISAICPNLIIDNAQAFFPKPLDGVDTFYSPRKFFGVPDGGYLYVHKSKYLLELDDSFSFDQMKHLLIRIDENAEKGYVDFLQNESHLDKQPIKKMSKLTNQILGSINYELVAEKRRSNYKYLHQILRDINHFSHEMDQNDVPLTYPFYSEGGLYDKLISNKVFCPKYWPNVLEWVDKKTVEYDFASNLTHLPIDQRLEKSHLDEIIELIVG